MPKSLFFRRLIIITQSAVASLIAVSSLLLVILHNFWIALPNTTEPTALQPEQSVRITDRYGTELYRIIGQQDRTFIALENIPKHVQNAFIAIEDQRFWQRRCIDMRALARAAVANIGDFGAQGGSTITQQLARTIWLQPEKSIDRKIREILLACRLEHEKTKAEILELYLNWIAFGHGISGIQQASQFYFGVPASKLTLEQAAVLAAMPQRPSYFSPYGKHAYVILSDEMKRQIRSGTFTDSTQLTSKNVTPGLLGRKTRLAKQPFIIEGRANVVLRKMYDQQLITAAEYATANNQVVTLQFTAQGHRITAPHFSLWVRSQIAQTGTIPDSVNTTLDTAYQALAEQAVATYEDRLQTEFGAQNVALLAVDRTTREVLAYVGNTNFFSQTEGQVDMVQALRQPGSSFKPVVYAAAYERGYTPQSEIIDAPLTLGPYKPKNYEGGYRWRMTMAEALAASRNIPAIKTFFRAGGEEAVLRTAAALGATSPFAVSTLAERQNLEFSYGWPLALGSAEVSLLEMVAAYTSLANEGVYAPLGAMRNIEQKNRTNNAGYQAVTKSTALNITLALSDKEKRPNNGWRQAMELPNLDAAIKTGTSNTGPLPRDTWVLGYTPEFVVGVWVGNSDGTPLALDANGLVTALPIWKDFIMNAHAARPFGRRYFEQKI